MAVVALEPKVMHDVLAQLGPGYEILPAAPIRTSELRGCTSFHDAELFFRCKLAPLVYAGDSRTISREDTLSATSILAADLWLHAQEGDATQPLVVHPAVGLYGFVARIQAATPQLPNPAIDLTDTINDLIHAYHVIDSLNAPPTNRVRTIDLSYEPGRTAGSVYVRYHSQRHRGFSPVA